MDGEALKCAQCGEVLSGEENYCPRCKNPISRICSGCGRELGPEVNFCPHCGAKSDVENDPQGQPGVSAPNQVFSPYLSSPNANLVSPNGGPFPDIAPAGSPAPPFAQPSAFSTIQINPGEELLGGRFVVKELLGFGGFGSVYLAKDKEMDDDLALKVVFTQLAQAQMAVDQLKFEFKARKEIRDRKHILEAELPLRDEFKGVSLILLPMEYAEGGSLRNWMRANPAIYEENEETAKRKKQTLEYFKQACRGVQAIHEAGLVHLDLKPENLLIQKKTIKVADFGLSRNLLQLRVASPDLMRDGVGTPVYMSPEQVRSARQKDVNKLSDIYSLGIILFELLDGSVPFEGNLDELKEKHLTYKPPSLDGLLAPWGRIVNRCLAKEPSKRYPSVNELLADLDRCDTGDILSVDIACNNCGHINANKDLKKCQKCGEDINHLFHRCPNCRRLNRLDVETCADCDFEVARHFRVLDLLEKANELRDMDPDKAMRSLLEVLKLEGGNREAKEMLPGLRNVQEKIEGIIPKAEAAEKKGRLEDARGRWQDILSLAPRHVIATGKKKELDELIDRYNVNYDRAFVLMDQGKFPQARELLNECREMIPARKETDDAFANLNKRDKFYSQHLEKAKSLIRRKSLNSASKELELCLEEAPKSKEVLNLRAKVNQDVNKADELFGEAKSLLKMAKFESVGRNIDDIIEIQNDLSGFHGFVKGVEEKKKKFHSFSSKWAKSLEPEVRDLNKAQKYLEAGLKICPECREVNKLLDQVIRDKGQANSLIEDAKSNIRSAKFAKASNELAQAESIWLKVRQLTQTREKLETTQRSYKKHIDAARQLYEEKKDLVPALERVEEALKACPDSTEAKTVKNKIKGDQKRVIDLLYEVTSLISKADFDNASKHIEEAESIWPHITELEQVKSDLKKRKKAYGEHFKKARDLCQKKDLDFASASAKSALNICGESAEAKHLLNKIVGDKKKALKLVEAIPYCIESAQFDMGKTKMKDAADIWPSVPNLNNIKTELEAKEEEYSAFYDKAKYLFDRRRKLKVALEKAHSALEVCRKSSEASALIKDITNNLDKRKDAIKTKRLFFIRASVVLIVAAGLAVAAIYVSRIEKESKEEKIKVGRLNETSSINIRNMKKFINKYLAVLNQGKPNKILTLYADKVDYFAKGIVSKDFIRKDKTNYYKRWPEVKNSLKGDIVIKDTPDKDTKLVFFRTNFFVRSPKRNQGISGTAKTTLKIRKNRGVLKIISEKQKVINRTKTKG